MVEIVLASALARWLDGSTGASREPRLSVEAADLRSALDALFRQHPRLRGYVLDEHGRVRHHVAVFIDGTALRSKADLSQPVSPHSQIYLLQALSGG